MPRRLPPLGLVLAILAIAGLIALSGQSAAQNFDRNDRASVMRALRSAMGADARLLDIYPACIATPPHFPDLVIARMVVPDGGCQLLGVFVRGRWRRETATDGLLDRVGIDALAARGWRTADGETRRTLAQQWVVEALFADSAVRDPTSLPPNLRRDGLTAPESLALRDGGVEIRLWVVGTTIRGPELSRATVVIGPDARARPPAR